MTLQGVLTALVVACAIAYLAYKVLIASRPRARKGPDVPVSRLVRGKEKRRPSGSCHG